MLIQIVWLIVGLVLLLFAGDALVRGAVSAALKVGVSPLVAGIVVVGFGTSLPEVLVSVEAAFTNAEDLAHGNIVGSNIANFWLVLAVPAIIAPVATSTYGMRRSMMATVIATLAWIFVTRWFGLNPVVGAVFLTAMFAYVGYIVLSSRKEMALGKASSSDAATDLEDEVGGVDLPVWQMVLYILIGLVGLFLGARLTINAGVEIAKMLHVSEALIGLTLLAIGTSLPEIGAGLAAALRKQGDVALGNVVGSNMFNLFAAGGAVALVKTQQLAPSFHQYSHIALALATAMIATYVMLKAPIGRATGFLMLGLYSLYIIGLVNGWSLGDINLQMVEDPAQ